jgi:hypothetical protein
MIAGKILGLVESGLTPDEIISQLQHDSIWRDSPENEKEKFSNEIRIISQPLAYRSAILDDARSLVHLLNNAYSAETIGDESFRKGNLTTLSEIEELICDEDYKWLVMEAPDGLRGGEEDGFLLGAACYSNSGVSRCNGIALIPPPPANIIIDIFY